MSSNGILKIAKTGKCRICRRVRKTSNHLKVVGEVKHGYATGYIWECINIEDCDKVAFERARDTRRNDCYFIQLSIKKGRSKDYIIKS